MPNKETKFKFIIQHGDQTVELTIEEAEKLYTDLSKIFAPKINWKKYPVDNPILPIPNTPGPWVPQNPWDQNTIICTL